MHPLLGVVYLVACVLVPCALYPCVLYRKWQHGHPLSKRNLLWRYVLIFYLFLVMRAVGMGSVWDIAAYGLEIRWDTINLIPFDSEGFLTYGLNIVLFVPLGFLLPLIWKRNRSLARTAGTGFLFSLAIELGQLFNHRLTDLDDIVMNVLGTLLGYGAWCLLDRRFHIRPKEKDIFPDHSPAYLVLTILGTFFLYNWRWTVPLSR